MTLTDDQLLDFHHKRLAHFDAAAARRTLAEQREAFRAQLVAARWIDGWRERMTEDDLPHASEDYNEGFQQALREVAAHLRQGDLIPGGVQHPKPMGAGCSGAPEA